ncbi:MAG: glycosyltransferase [Crocinitomicaceae bacterium]|jgi:glycosyltransferase involved in cell wall biosynthesis|nr:glycosyltransferase [Crocinitomicaceae bacterium]
MKKAYVLVSNDLYTDQRVHKVCEFLHENGMDVTLLGRKLPNSKELEPRNYSTKRFGLWFKKGPLFYANLNLKLYTFLFFKKCDLIVANDLDTLMAGYLSAKRKKNCELVYDSHEFYTGVPELVNRPSVQRIWERIEGWIFPKLNKIYTVNQSIADIYEKKYGEKLFVVRNVSPRITDLDIVSKETYEIPSDKKMLILQGAGINVDRGAEELVEAMIEIDEAVLVIVGDGDVVPQLKTFVEANNLDQKVFFLGKKPYLEMLAISALADIGFSLDKSTNINYENSLPNKIFDYIQAGTPIIASNIKEVRNVVETHEIGLIIEEVSASILTENIKKMLKNEEKRVFFTENCKKTAQSLNWENEKAVLKKIYFES